MLSQRTFPQGEDGTDDFLFAEKNSLANYGYNIQNSQNMALKRNADGSAIVHTEVSKARVFVTTTEDDTKSDKDDGLSSNGISDTDNKGNSSTADISSSLNSVSSNDNGSVGKVGTNGNLSDAITGGNSQQRSSSRHSVGNSSSMQEADAKQKEGEYNTYPQQQFGGQTQQPNDYNANGYKPNEYHNGNQ